MAESFNFNSKLTIKGEYRGIMNFDGYPYIITIVEINSIQYFLRIQISNDSQDVQFPNSLKTFGNDSSPIIIDGSFFCITKFGGKRYLISEAVVQGEAHYVITQLAAVGPITYDMQPVVIEEVEGNGSIARLIPETDDPIHMKRHIVSASEMTGRPNLFLVDIDNENGLFICDPIIASYINFNIQDTIEFGLHLYPGYYRFQNDVQTYRMLSEITNKEEHYHLERLNSGNTSGNFEKRRHDDQEGHTH